MDLTSPLMTIHGISVNYRPDLFVMQSEGGMLLIVDADGKTPHKGVQRVVPLAQDAESIKEKARAHFAKVKRDPAVTEEKRIKRLEKSQRNEALRAAAHARRVEAVRDIVKGFDPMYDITLGQCASQIAKRTGDTRLAAYYWLVKENKKAESDLDPYLAAKGTGWATIQRQRGGK